MNGKLIVIDGLDGSGKSTQAKRVAAALTQKGIKNMLISFPDYEKPSSALVKMYLSGVFSENANDVNAYAAASILRYCLHRSAQTTNPAHRIAPDDCVLHDISCRKDQ